MSETGSNLNEYLGDGVYVTFGGFGMMLKANSPRQPTDQVYLEPDTFKNLMAFARKCGMLDET